MRWEYVNDTEKIATFEFAGVPMSGVTGRSSKLLDAVPEEELVVYEQDRPD